MSKRKTKAKPQTRTLQEQFREMEAQGLTTIQVSPTMLSFVHKMAYDSAFRDKVIKLL